jgi:hypothetical protein
MHAHRWFSVSVVSLVLLGFGGASVTSAGVPDGARWVEGTLDLIWGDPDALSDAGSIMVARLRLADDSDLSLDISNRMLADLGGAMAANGFAR